MISILPWNICYYNLGANSFFFLQLSTSQSISLSQLTTPRSEPLLSTQTVLLSHPLLSVDILSRSTAPMQVKLSRNLKEEIARLILKTFFSIHTSIFLLARHLSRVFTFSRSLKLLRSVFRLGSLASRTETFKRKLRPKTQNQGTYSIHLFGFTLFILLFRL